jgi:hypothetical protein
MLSLPGVETIRARFAFYVRRSPIIDRACHGRGGRDGIETRVAPPLHYSAALNFCKNRDQAWFDADGGAPPLARFEERS